MITKKNVSLESKLYQSATAFLVGVFKRREKFTSRALASEVTKLGICLVSTNQHATTLALIAQSLKTFFMGTFEWRENSETIQ